MRILIVGAGEVGSTIAANLADAHDVVVVDVDPERVEALTYSLDVLAIQGSGTSLSTLREADISRADIVIASTDDDETNLAICGTAKTLDDPFTIARVKNIDYQRTWQHARDAFGVDFMVCTDLLSARDIVRVAGLPAARDVDLFAGQRVEMAEFEVDAESPVANTTVREADRFEALTFVAVVRDDAVVIPQGETVIEPGNRVVVIGTPESVQEFAGEIVAGATHETDDFVVVGGSEIGRHTARLLGQAGFSPRLIERDPERSREIAAELPDTVVLEHDATDVSFLRQEFVHEADIVVAALDNDEKNLLVALLVKQLGVDRTVAIVEDGEYVDLFETVGVDVAISPREVTAEEIIRFTKERRAENVSLIQNDKAEVVEIEVGEESHLAGRAIRDAVAELPQGIVVGAITRDDEFITPRGDTVIEPRDHVVLFAYAEIVDDVLARV